jgi:hypothetical protein
MYEMHPALLLKSVCDIILVTVGVYPPVKYLFVFR